MVDKQTLREVAQAAINGDDCAYDILCDDLGSGVVVLSLLDELQTLREERTTWRVTAENAEAAVKQARIDALEEAKQAVSAEEILDSEDNADDAYNCGVLDCVRAVEKLKGKTP